MGTKAATTVHRIPLTKARHNLGAVIKRVHVNKEYFILERDGIPVAGMMDADELEDYLELRDSKVQEQVRKATMTSVPAEPDRSSNCLLSSAQRRSQ